MINIEQDFKVRHKEAEDALREVSQKIKESLPANMGFTLLIFDYGEGGNMFYSSSAKRGDMIKAMEEFIEKQTGKNEK